jgi:hypothetical protein
MIKLACRVFGVHATRSLKSPHPNRPQSGVSLITEALVKNRIHIEEKTIQKHIWFGVPGHLVKRVNDEEALVDFANRWAQAAPFLQDLMRWIMALEGANADSSAYKLALRLLAEAFKCSQVGGDVVLSSQVTGMPRSSKSRAAKELQRLGLIRTERQKVKQSSLVHVLVGPP